MLVLIIAVDGNILSTKREKKLPILLTYILFKLSSIPIAIKLLFDLQK